MGVVWIDSNAGRSARVRRPVNPGGRPWWDRLRGALAALTLPGQQREGEGCRPSATLPALYDHTPESRAALGRVVQSVVQPSAASARPGG